MSTPQPPATFTARELAWLTFLKWLVDTQRLDPWGQAEA